MNEIKVVARAHNSAIDRIVALEKTVADLSLCIKALGFTPDMLVPLVPGSSVDEPTLKKKVK